MHINCRAERADGTPVYFTAHTNARTREGKVSAIRSEVGAMMRRHDLHKARAHRKDNAISGWRPIYGGTNRFVMFEQKETALTEAGAVASRNSAASAHAEQSTWRSEPADGSTEQEPAYQRAGDDERGEENFDKAGAH